MYSVPDKKNFSVTTQKVGEVNPKGKMTYDLIKIYTTSQQLTVISFVQSIDTCQVPTLSNCYSRSEGTDPGVSEQVKVMVSKDILLEGRQT